MLLLTSSSWHVTVYSLYYCEERMSHRAHMLIAVAGSVLQQSVTMPTRYRLLQYGICYTIFLSAMKSFDHRRKVLQ